MESYDPSVNIASAGAELLFLSSYQVFFSPFQKGAVAAYISNVGT